jgi:hypothetical protein
MRASIIIGLAVALAALAVGCGDNDEFVPIDAPDAIDAAVDAGADAEPTTICPCLDRPTYLPSPPIGRLPCELIPPGVTLSP